MTSAQAVSLPRFWPLFLIAIGSRIVIVIIGCILGSLPPDNRPKDDRGELLTGPEELHAKIMMSSARPIEPWYRWDAGWYVNVGTNGYSKASDELVKLGGTAFLPALPLCFAAAMLV